ncbi:SUMF1/EgtB/PvdO family nonheme iron enzyme [Haloferula sp. BvORR071]|uniref:SUMF1/EgtB/PvdO family nonheme iron enzyme n=1 Tax=Haloferula sp. BvORR071 TaxID=1396141 RepID=UPI000553F292|nr:SUMF1/EgtB/PvdO family nonheme iron enzyme [Haloferula sp. BvORR071]
MDDPRSRADTMLGDYRLDTLIGESPVTLTWQAEQASIHRPVLLFELKPTAFDRRDKFLADMQVKAAVDHPLVGSVYEAVSNAQHCYATLERLPGNSLEARMNARQSLKPAQVAQILRRVSEASMTLEAAGISTAPLGPDDVFLDDHGVVRIANLARAGERPPGRSADDILTLGRTLPPLVADGRPGASRMVTLLAWMRGENLGRTMTWMEVHSYAEQIEQQLAEPHAPHVAAPPTARAVSAKSPLPLILGIVALGFLACLGLLAMKGKGNGKPPSGQLPPPVIVLAGSHPLPDGGTARLSAFSLSGHEVTIGEYAEFLAALNAAPAERRNGYNHAEQPAEKTHHEPEGWTAMHSAAKAGGQWEGRAMSRDCPVVNVDWWDAYAYCKWKNSRLPTQEEWFAAMRVDLADPGSLRPAGWGPVQEAPPTDRTPSGLVGMAGSVTEWTASLAKNPANPLGEQGWVLIGGSFMKPSTGALARQWVDKRDIRHPDLGFRVIEQ